MTDVEKFRLAIEALTKIKALADDTSEDPATGKQRISLLAGQCLQTLLTAPPAPRIKEQRG